jgi:chorismate mutase
METTVPIAPISSWATMAHRPLVIAGPCSAESEAQVMATALALAAIPQVSIFRIGLWKARTSPDSFEGSGSAGWPWLKKVREKTGLTVAVEVANARHVEEAWQNGLSVFWLGARTTASPFAVQAIAEAVRGLDVTILIKNPINPDIELWIGAIRRMASVGITKMAAIHRGFSSYAKNEYRNRPHWPIPIELKRRFPAIPIIVDPSHIAGNTSLLADIAQKALDLSFDGLMIESHFDPAQARSDAQQQITPSGLKQLLAGLIVRTSDGPQAPGPSRLAEWRERIDNLDDHLLDLLAERLEIAEAIGRYKKANNVAIFQSKRWEEVVRRVVARGGRVGISPECVMAIYQAIHEESILHQMQIMDMDKADDNLNDRD